MGLLRLGGIKGAKIKGTGDKPSEIICAICGHHDNREQPCPDSRLEP